ncbi:MAG TPA: M14 family zinc carboxypeptidase, partial [Gemmatimonadaceae bacterium]
MRRWTSATLAAGALTLAAAAAAGAQAQKNDELYTAQIKQYLSDPRISTELVDHLPASATVPTPLKFLGHIVGAPGILDHAADIHRYLQAVAKAAPKRAKYWTIGKTEEGREMVMLAIGSEEAIANLDRYKHDLNELTDPRKTTEARARQLIHTAKPIYWITSGIHSPESGGPEMLMELAYRLVVEETPFIQNIRNNVITLITPVVEVDGREKYVDNHYFNEKWNKEHGVAEGAPGGRGGGP